MKKIVKEVFSPVTVVIPMRNASTTVGNTLATITKQTYPIAEIIAVDNVSKDNSKEIVQDFAKKSNIKIRLLSQKKDKGVSSSYNWGVKEAKTKLVVFLTSDCSLPSMHELKKLVIPFKEKEVVATYSTCVLPKHIWDTYNFWEKFFAARMVDFTQSNMVLKFDCVMRDAFLSIGGFDEKHFGGDGAIGGEDADLTTRLRKIGKITKSNALSYHLHYKGDDYSLNHMARSRKMYARSQGRFFRKYGLSIPQAWIAFLTRPLLAIVGVFPVGWSLLLLYGFLYTPKMFLARETRMDIRIALVPLLNIYFLYYELFWFVEAFHSYKK